MNKADKRVVIITGSSRGLGKKIALRFGKAGDRVVVNYRDRKDDAVSVVHEIAGAGRDAISFCADVRMPSSVDAMVAECMSKWGGIDILVNNAGLTRDGLMLRMSEQDWDDVLDTNLKGAFHLIRSVSPFMMKNRRGHIINIASITGVQGREGQANYAASKAGLIGLTKAAAKEFGRFNVQVNAVLPGYLPTEMGGNVTSTLRERILKENALGRVSDPIEVAEFIYRLTLMNNISGQVFNLDSRII